MNTVFTVNFNDILSNPIADSEGFFAESDALREAYYAKKEQIEKQGSLRIQEIREAYKVQLEALRTEKMQNSVLIYSSEWYAIEIKIVELEGRRDQETLIVQTYVAEECQLAEIQYELDKAVIYARRSAAYQHDYAEQSAKKATKVSEKVEELKRKMAAEKVKEAEKAEDEKVYRQRREQAEREYQERRRQQEEAYEARERARKEEETRRQQNRQNYHRESHSHQAPPPRYDSKMTKSDAALVLGVPVTADKATAKKAYYRLAAQHHPDVNPGDVASEEMMKKVTVAYEFFS